MKKTAAIYVRCATKKQIPKSSLERQFHYCTRWCNEVGAEYTDILADIGSGFHGFHLQEHKSKFKGHLGRILTAYETGLVVAPDFFLSESIDRIDDSYTEIANIKSRLNNVGTTLVFTAVDSFPEMWHSTLTYSEKLALYQI